MYLDTSNAQSLKEKLLLSAVNEFAEYGYEGARVDNIVKAADCSKQTVYHHFGNKENLFIEVLEYIWNDIRQKEKNLDVSGLSLTKQLKKSLILLGTTILKTRGFSKLFIMKIKAKAFIMQNQRASRKLTTRICN